mgnify:CR=1 FL=1
MVGDKVKFYAGKRGYLVGTVVKEYTEQGQIWLDVMTDKGTFTVPPDQCEFVNP